MTRKLPFPETLDEETQPFAVVSATECTGLIPAAPDSAAEVESYQHLYDVPLAKRPVSHKKCDD